MVLANEYLHRRPCRSGGQQKQNSPALVRLVWLGDILDSSRSVIWSCCLTFTCSLESKPSGHAEDPLFPGTEATIEIT